MSINYRALRHHLGVDCEASKYYRDNICYFYLDGFKGWLARLLLGDTLKKVVITSYSAGWEWGHRKGVEKRR